MPEISTLQLNGVSYDVRDPTKAPAGYGLGGDCQYLDNWENATKNGFYYSYSGLPGGYEGYTFQGIAVDYNGYIILNIWQTGGTTSDNIHLFRKYVKTSQAWGEWEYVNPPMVTGVEYRTTERWNGKAVYTKLVNIGTLPNTAICQTDMGIPSNSTRIIGVELSVLRNDNALLSPVMFGKEVYFISGWNGNWFYSFTTEDDKSAYTATIAIRYVKD